jgi:hypothetical protein
MFDSQLLSLTDVAPWLLALGIAVMVPLLPVSRRDYAVIFCAALGGVIVPVALTVIASELLAKELGLRMLDIVLFWVPVVTAPAAVAGVEVVRGHRISWRGIIASMAFVSIFATSLLVHYERTSGPRHAVFGAICLIGWVLAPAAIVAVTYTVGAWKDDRVREAKQRAQAERPRPGADMDGTSP